jgi:predicted aconitase with swiveling domain
MRFVFRPLCLLLSAILVAGLPVQAQSGNPAGPDDIQELHLRVIEGQQRSVEPGKSSKTPLILAVTDGRNAPVPSATVLVRLPADGATGAFSDGSRVSVLYTDMTGQVAVTNIRWGSTEGTAVVRITASKGSAHAGILFEQTIGTVSTRAAASITAASPAIQPGQPKAEPSQDATISTPAASAATASATASASAPADVVINNHPDRQLTGATGAHSKKWLWIGLGVAAAAGAAVAVVGKGGSSGSPSTSSSATTVGTPTVSIGHP